MPEAKIEVKIGDLAFSGEGDSSWLETQLDKILAWATTAPMNIAPNGGTRAATGAKTPAGSATSLAAYLKSKSAIGDQTKTFLATAQWLASSGKPLSTALVTATLKAHHQGKLGNAAQCLINNVGKGYCNGSRSFPPRFSRSFPLSFAVSCGHPGSPRWQRGEEFGRPSGGRRVEYPRPPLRDSTIEMGRGGR